MKTKIFLVMALMAAIIAVAFAQNGKEDVAKLPNEVKEWKMQAEQGDTAALHNLLRYLDENAVIYVEVEEVTSADGEDITDEALNDNTTLADEVFSNFCAARLEYWLEKGLARGKLYIDMWFGNKPHFDSYIVKIGDGIMQEWYDVKDSIPLLPNAIGHRCDADSSWGYYKYFSTYEGKPVYYNDRHGFYVGLPDGMGYNQFGENMMGAHGNEFYNNDTTLVISADAMYYDAVLCDEPNYADTLKATERQYLIELGNCKPTEISPDVWISTGRINHANPDNPPADRFIRKWLLKKDIEERECEMSLTIYFNDSLEYNLPKFKNIINQFPDKPNFPQSDIP